MIIFLLAWSILWCCLHTQATNFFSRSKSKIFHPSASSSHCLLDFVKMIFLILPPFSYAFRFHAKLLCCWSVTVFHCQFDNCFFYSIVNGYLFSLWDIKSFLFSVLMLPTYLEAKLNLTCFSAIISHLKIVLQSKIFHDFQYDETTLCKKQFPYC